MERVYCQTMVSRAVFVSTALVLMLSLAACGGDPPEKEIQQAESAIATARAAGAEAYGADELAAATAALKNARIAVEQHDYRLALNHALDSRERAETAAKMAADARAAARSKADAAIQSASGALESARARLKAAESAKAPARMLGEARNTVTEAESQLQEARSALERGDVVNAAEAGTAIAARLKAAEEALAAASPAPSRRRR